MADQADVEAALVGLVGGALYPAGLAGPCVVAGAVARVFRGWPVPAALDADLAARCTNVSVVAVAPHSRNTTRWPDEWLAQPRPATTLTATVAGARVTFGGSARAGEVAAVVADAAWAAWRMQASDTPASVAAGLAGLLSRARAATAAGATLLVPGAARLLARVAADQPSLRQTRRQEQAFRVTVWCADPSTRDAVGSAIDAALSGIDFISLADGTSGRLRFLASAASDRWQDAVLFRRELSYRVDYATTIAASLPRMAVGALAVRLGGSPGTETLLT